VGPSPPFAATRLRYPLVLRKIDQNIKLLQAELEPNILLIQ